MFNSNKAKRSIVKQQGESDRVHFGLGSVDQIDRFVVRWPDGQVQ